MTDRWAFEVMVDLGENIVHDTAYDYASKDEAYIACFLWIYGYAFQGDPTAQQVWGYVVREDDESGTEMVTAGIPTAVHYCLHGIHWPITVYCDDGSYLGTDEFGASYWGEGHPSQDQSNYIVMAWSALTPEVRAMVHDRVREGISHLEMEHA